ncbi:MAG: efflux RND transporter periplasmic adaptor subunit [Prevotella sp.]|nr:efflux RND transporter periplasmic adaptor subunit [Prevotella sp.]
MKKKVVFLLAAVLMMASCREKDGLDAAEQTSFETMTVSKQDITLEQSYPAQIDGRQSVKIIPRVEGYLRQICVKEGQRVKKGQVLFVIDQATYQAEVKAAEANVAVAKAGVETAQLNYDSRKTLFQKDVVSDYDLRTATANLSMAKAQAQQAQAQLLSARTNLSYTVLRSPSDGVVGSLPFRTGDFVGPSTPGGLTTVADARKATDETIRRLYDVLNALAVLQPSEGLTQLIQQLQAIEDRARQYYISSGKPSTDPKPEPQPEPDGGDDQQDGDATVK